VTTSDFKGKSRRAMPEGRAEWRTKEVLGACENGHTGGQRGKKKKKGYGLARF